MRRRLLTESLKGGGAWSPLPRVLAFLGGSSTVALEAPLPLLDLSFSTWEARRWAHGAAPSECRRPGARDPAPQLSGGPEFPGE